MSLWNIPTNNLILITEAFRMKKNTQECVPLICTSSVQPETGSLLGKKKKVNEMHVLWGSVKYWSQISNHTVHKSTYAPVRGPYNSVQHNDAKCSGTEEHVQLASHGVRRNISQYISPTVERHTVHVDWCQNSFSWKARRSGRRML